MMSTDAQPAPGSPSPGGTFYVTTPIYYVNDKPHIGHCYSTMVADCVARFERLRRGADRAGEVFFLTGTDEHAEKVVESAAQRGVRPIDWADINAEEFQAAFRDLGFTHNDFIRTTQPRHTEKVGRYIERLMEVGAVELGDYEGWFDPSQEEYVTENAAREHDYKSPITGKDLVKRTEKNYFFNLPDYREWLLEHIESNPGFLLPEARRNEVLARVRGELQRVPISRAVKDGEEAWGILMPGDEGHRVYVWIDALFNYLSTVDTPDRGRFWPANLHVLAKDILWFHAVIWPCMLRALDKPIPERLYVHSFWVREGRKMSKSLGNFVDMPTMDAYRAAFGDDALRWYLLTQGPLGATDADFAHEKFVEVYNSELANGVGNASSRVANMIAKYFDGEAPVKPATSAPTLTGPAADAPAALARLFDDRGAYADAFVLGLGLSNRVDEYISDTAPFKLAKDPANLPRVGEILYDCAEALRIAAILLSPAMPAAMADLLERFGQPRPNPDGSFDRPLAELCAWGGLAEGTTIVKGDPLFPRADPDAPAPAPIPTGGGES